ncbi:hypothetical protein jhhlp_007904 [Lomentospora prolificans]|uniref:Uncharacterized protein n=1 Tax=Lomentospora prolificans TaxID=41688 RepID=A0A2N3N0W1_9PEZI|nr:hypothetical protein jhhlp_007904 [Lomentospora prolificans]
MNSIASAGSGSYEVYLGFWTNWSRGPILGSTVTLTKQHGAFLIAFLAIYVAAAGKSVWRVACFAMHRRFSSRDPQDAIYHQRQAILRNVSNAQDAAWMLGNSLLMWRKNKAKQPVRRLVPIIILAVCISVIFGVAGIFSSQVTTDFINEVLLEGNNCGPLDSNDIEDPEGYTLLFQPYQSQRVHAYANYALRCYTDTATVEDCNLYTTPKLPTIVDRDAGCPFEEGMCKSKTGNLIVDTGYIDSNIHLGINLPPEDRFSLRMYHHCAPLVTEGFSEATNDSSSVPVMRYYYGEVPNKVGNFSYQMPINDSVASLQDSRTQSKARLDYNIGFLKFYGGDPEMSEIYSMFRPIPQITRRDADVMLFFLSAPGLLYANPVDDPWFSAHKEGPGMRNTVSNTTRPNYYRDELVTVMGCSMQTQLCNAQGGEDGCTPLRGMADDTFDRYSPWKTDRQRALIKRADDIFGMGLFSISGIVDHLGLGSLVSRHGLSSNVQGPLPTNQWQHEVEHWVTSSLTSVQGSFVEAANGPPKEMMSFRVVPNGTEEERLCRSQKIVSARYLSFSVLGVSVILIIGGIFMILDLVIEPLVSYIERRQQARSSDPEGAYARLEWSANAVLQLQRMAHEQVGLGTWTNTAGVNPVTLSNEKLAVLDITNEKHPQLRVPDGADGRPDLKKSYSMGSSIIESPTSEKSKAADG